MTRRIYLTQGKFTLVDDDNYDLLSQWKWCAHVKVNTTYAVRSIYDRGKWQTVPMHGVIMDQKYIDHINGLGLDNRKINLRLSSPLFNNRNRRPDRGHVFKGVRPSSGTRWSARIYADGERFCLGTFDDAETAARAYDRAAFEKDPVHCYLNFPDEYRG